MAHNLSNYEDNEIKIRVLDYLEEFTLAMFNSLTEGEKKHGNTWLKFNRVGQEGYLKGKFDKKFDLCIFEGIPVNWASIAGNAMIAWIRENHPELWEDPDLVTWRVGR